LKTPNPLVSGGKTLAHKPTFATDMGFPRNFSNKFENSPRTKKRSVALYPAADHAAILSTSLQTNTEAFLGKNHRFK
jgi:hypothetical protein